MSRKNKYGVAPKDQRTSGDGTVFASKGEMQRWHQLRLWQLSGEIRNLRRQVRYDLIVNGIKVGHVTFDFVYERKLTAPGNVVYANMMTDDGWLEVIEDFKGANVRDLPLRYAVFEATTGKKITLSRAKATRRRK